MRLLPRAASTALLRVTNSKAASHHCPLTSGHAWLTALVLAWETTCVPPIAVIPTHVLFDATIAEKGLSREKCVLYLVMQL